MKAKRLVALLMALVLMLGILAVPALAANAPDEGIDPQSQVIKCPRCGGSATTTLKYVPEEEIYGYRECPYNPDPHTHPGTSIYQTASCKCGWSYGPVDISGPFPCPYK
jgi:hypothetical protein